MSRISTTSPDLRPAGLNFLDLLKVEIAKPPNVDGPDVCVIHKNFFHSINEDSAEKAKNAVHLKFSTHFTGPDGKRLASASEFIPVLVHGVQQLSAENKTLTVKMMDLTNRLAELEKRYFTQTVILSKSKEKSVEQPETGICKIPFPDTQGPEAKTSLLDCPLVEIPLTQPKVMPFEVVCSGDYCVLNVGSSAPETPVEPEAKSSEPEVPSLEDLPVWTPPANSVEDSVDSEALPRKEETRELSIDQVPPLIEKLETLVKADVEAILTNIENSASPGTTRKDPTVLQSFMEKLRPSSPPPNTPVGFARPLFPNTEYEQPLFPVASKPSSEPKVSSPVTSAPGSPDLRSVEKGQRSLSPTNLRIEMSLEKGKMPEAETKTLSPVKSRPEEEHHVDNPEEKKNRVAKLKDLYTGIIRRTPSPKKRAENRVDVKSSGSKIQSDGSSIRSPPRGRFTSSPPPWSPESTASSPKPVVSSSPAQPIKKRFRIP